MKVTPLLLAGFALAFQLASAASDKHYFAQTSELNNFADGEYFQGYTIPLLRSRDLRAIIKGEVDTKHPVHSFILIDLRVIVDTANYLMTSSSDCYRKSGSDLQVIRKCYREILKHITPKEETHSPHLFNYVSELFLSRTEPDHTIHSIIKEIHEKGRQTNLDSSMPLSIEHIINNRGLHGEMKRFVKALKASASDPTKESKNLVISSVASINQYLFMLIKEFIKDVDMNNHQNDRSGTQGSFDSPDQSLISHLEEYTKKVMKIIRKWKASVVKEFHESPNSQSRPSLSPPEHPRDLVPAIRNSRSGLNREPKRPTRRVRFDPITEIYEIPSHSRIREDEME
ncbi:MAG: hypothetical protein DHS80DRAFT_28951 [Piptocephalis tieghemiana]|nr:MAG: hypothetical protein DHS80DRAFT_28951 [Piptocephalis tieghemiana]